MNRHSRRADAAAAHLHDGLRARGIRIAAFLPARTDKEAMRLVRRAAKGGAETIVVGGGDGTMTHAVDELANHKVVLGVLPLGTGNSFAQSLGLAPGDLDGAIAAIADGHVQRIDLGCVDGTHFANFATIGVSSQIAGATSHFWKRIGGTVAYGLGAIGPLLRHRGFRAEIRWDGGDLVVHTQDVIIANGRFFGDHPVTHDANLISGRLALVTLDDPSRIGALREYLAFGRGRQTDLHDAHVVRSTRFTVRAHPKQPVALDGSAFGRTPSHFSVARRALQVYVPASGVAGA